MEGVKKKINSYGKRHALKQIPAAKQANEKSFSSTKKGRYGF
jgi:hypothetical protein